MLNIKEIKSGNFILNAHDDTIGISGSIDVFWVNKLLSSFFLEVHNAILSLGIKSVKVDVTNLSFLNSCGIKEIVSWVLKQQKLADNQKYNILFQCNSKISWQEMTFTSIVRLNPKYMKIEYV